MNFKKLIQIQYAKTMKLKFCLPLKKYANTAVQADQKKTLSKKLMLKELVYHLYPWSSTALWIKKQNTSDNKILNTSIFCTEKTQLVNYFDSYFFFVKSKNQSFLKECQGCFCARRISFTYSLFSSLLDIKF